MSPRQTRAGVTGQSVITTRARAQKLNDAKVSAKPMEKIKRPHKREKSLDIQSDIEANTKQIAKRELSGTNVRFSKSTKRKVSRRRTKLAKEVEDEDIPHEIGSKGPNKLNKLLKNGHSNSMLAMEHTKNNSIQSSEFKDLDWDKTPKSLQRENTVLLVKVSPCMITPKSTPIKLNLTPHRSTKTPKKSPVSLGSPKTHSVASPKLLKSPRKLSLSSCDNLNKPDSCNSILQKTKQHNISNTSTSDESLSTSQVKSKHSKCSVNLKKIIRKFSKSPKIVLRSPKSKKSRSPKLKLLSPSRIKKSPLKRSPYSIFNKSDLNTTKSIRTNARKTPSPKSKNALTIKRLLLKPRLMKILTDSQIKDILAEPVVLLERLSLKNMQTMLMTVRKNLSDISIGTENSCKVLTPIARKTSVELDACTYLGNTQRNPATKLLKKSASRLSLSTTQNSLIEGKKRSISLKASTPREEKVPIIEINTTLNTSIISTNDTSPNTRSRYKNQSNVHAMQLPSMANKSITTERESKSTLFNISDSNLNRASTVTKRTVTYNINEGTTTPETEPENRKNTTYELIEPQTPSLQWLIKKRTATEANLGAKEDIKRTCKVRFANSTSDNSSLYKSINKLNRLQSNISHNSSRQMDTPRSNKNSLISSAKSKSSTVNNRITPKSQVVRRSQSFNNMISNLSSNKIQTTPKAFASAEKKSEKKSSIKKVPNFSRIHEKMFAKSESLIDAKKRLEDRHQAFATSKILPKMDAKKEIKPLPTDANNSAYNRFGFKLRKAEATHIMLKKQTVFSRQKQQHETRMVLKGVRTNRRFELQMKSRNISA